MDDSGYKPTPEFSNKTVAWIASVTVVACIAIVFIAAAIKIAVLIVNA